MLGMRHYDVQLIGGMVLHRGTIAEMKTGEGKTLVATLPVYLNALSGKGVHVVTVNDYLARRDAEWMGRIYRFLGLSVGIIVHGLSDAERQQSYRLRHHVRHEQRVRLRLPARQHEEVDRALCPARPQLRDRRRGRLDPDRRGAHAAHHLGLGRAVGRPLPEGRRHHPAAAQGHRLHRRREGALGDPDRRRRRADREAPRRRQPLRPRQHRVAPPRHPGAARAHAVQARRQLPDRRRQDHHRRRVHRPQDAGAPLVRRPAPGDRGQGGGRGPGGEPDPRDHHASRTTSACTRSWPA